jgi:hypothetical protein
MKWKQSRICPNPQTLNKNVHVSSPDLLSFDHLNLMDSTSTI